jgi:signal transduction histidine kinase/ActR/RegA family two-component response regulator
MNRAPASAAAGGRRFLWWLALSTASLAGLVAGMLVLQMRQSQNLEDNWQLKADSVTALTFQFEREFLRLRHTVDTASQNPSAVNVEDLVLRYNIFLSRKLLLDDNPSTRLIRHRTEYTQLLPRLADFVSKADPVFAVAVPDPAQLRGLLVQLNEMGPDVQALSFAATSVTTELIESKQQTIRAQSTTIARLTVAQLVLLLLAAGALWARHKRLVREREALEYLTQNLREARQKAEAASAGKSRFLANMSHELRTPFNGMLGMLSALENTPLNEQQLDYACTARESAQHLLTLLNDILDFSAMEAGKLKLVPGPVALRDVFAEVQALMQISAHSKGLAFNVHLPPDLPDWVHADKTRLKQILFNLVSNAIKFTTQGQIDLFVDTTTAPDGIASARIRVVDTGIGISEEAMGQLFQRFSQVESGVDRRFGGAGLGLDISRTLARLMGGDLSVTSKPGVGSTFTLELPLPLCQALPPPHQTQHPEAMSRAPSGSANTRTGVHRWQVMVAEDHPVNRKMMAALLDKLDCDVTFCENGQEAVDAAQNQVFDLIFMDIHMPVMDGLAATRLIRLHGLNRDSVPIVALTADVMSEARDNAMLAGVSEFLSKPVRLTELQACITKWMTHRPAAGR